MVSASRPSCDFSPNGRVDIADAISLVSYLLLGGPAPRPKYYSVELAWDPVNRDERGSPEQVAGYRIYFFDRGFRVLVKEVEDCACATLNDLSPGVEYSVGVTAVDLAGNESATSEKITIDR